MNMQCASSRTNRAAGFTITEMMAVMALLSVVASIGLPRLARSREAGDVQSFAQRIGKTLELARVRAVAARRPYLVRIRSLEVTLQFLDDAGVAQDERRELPDRQALVWDVANATTPPTMAQPFGEKLIRFNPDFTFTVNGASGTNAYVYVASDVSAMEGRRYVVSVIGTGAVAVWDSW